MNWLTSWHPILLTGLEPVLIGALVSAAVSAASYALNYFLTPKPKPLRRAGSRATFSFRIRSTA
ncbi:MAG: hypothetical protein U0Z53_23760 [Blastocatellia bacterium]